MAKSSNIKDYGNYEYDSFSGIWYPKPVTEHEITSGWIQYGLFDNSNGDSDDADPFQVGDLVSYNGDRARIEEAHGKNPSGIYEYYIQFCIPTKGSGIYVTEREITLIERAKKSLPALPVEEASQECSHSNAYENVVSSTLKFWVCPECKSEVDGPKPKQKYLNQQEVDELIDKFMSGKP